MTITQRSIEPTTEFTRTTYGTLEAEPSQHKIIMSHNKPEFLDLRSKSSASVSRPLKSPRLHVAGEAPPELSPLDAFAKHSRLLAKQLEDSARQGRRMSRLPPLTVESPLIKQARSDYFRSLSQDSCSDNDESPLTQPFVGLGLTEVDEEHRPRSMHPRMSRIPPTPDESIPVPALPNRESQEIETVNEAGMDGSLFGSEMRRETSPIPIERSLTVETRSDAESTTQDSYTTPFPTLRQSMSVSPERSHRQDSFDLGGLAPPRPLFPKRSSSIMSSTDEDGANSLSTSFHSQGRKLSTGSSALSPSLGHYQRSPSVSSETSGLPRPSFNFSRPLSRAGTPSFDTPARQASSDSHASFVFADDTAHTPISMNGEGFPDGPDGKPAAASYVHSKITLPRGKALQRNSMVLLDDKQLAQLSEEQQEVVPPSTAQTHPIVGQPPPSPPTRPSSAAGTRLGIEEPVPRRSQERSKLSIEVPQLDQEPAPTEPPRASTESAAVSSEARPQSASNNGRTSVEANHIKTPVSVTTSDTASTVKAARSMHSTAPTMTDLTAEEHVSKSIALHEKGALQESTWHLRHAAKQGHPTGMLLYALACRHGWGMRPNQREGVEWLRKAAESAQLELADDEGQAKDGKKVDVVEHKTRKAQFALSIYELGVSHMNGWGIEQDKALALRCFEIAGCKFSRFLTIHFYKSNIDMSL